MNKRMGCLLVFFGVPLALSAAIYLYFYPYSWNQKLMLEVETPDGVRSGTAVTSIEWRNNPFSGGWGGARMHQKTIGEAVVVDLGDGQYLFALLGGETTANFATQLVMDTTKRAWSAEAFKGVHTLPRPAIVPPKLYPMLVTFNDINDPASVREVDPDDLDAVFGCTSSTESKPWRIEGVSWHHWSKRSFTLKTAKKIGIEAGLTKEASDALFAVQMNNWFLDDFPELASEYKLASSQKQKLSNKYNGADWRNWVKHWEENYQDQFNGPFRRDMSNDCYKLKSISLEITDEPVTKGKVEKVLGRNPGDGSLDKIWQELPTTKRRILSSINWIKD